MVTGSCHCGANAEGCVDAGYCLGPAASAADRERQLDASIAYADMVARLPTRTEAERQADAMVDRAIAHAQHEAAVAKLAAEESIWWRYCVPCECHVGPSRTQTKCRWCGTPFGQSAERAA